MLRTGESLYIVMAGHDYYPNPAYDVMEQCSDDILVENAAEKLGKEFDWVLVIALRDDGTIERFNFPGKRLRCKKKWERVEPV